MTQKKNTFKKIKQLFIFSDGSTSYDFTLALKNKKKRILLNQDLNNHSFWVGGVKQANLVDKIRLAAFRKKYYLKD